MTNNELSKLLGWPINSVTPRVHELRGQGRVVLSRKRKCGVSGKWAMAWKIKKGET